VTVYLNDIEVATVQATPEDLDDLAIGFLSSEGLLSDRVSLHDVTVDAEKGLVWVRSEDEVPEDLTHRRRYITAGCGKGVTFASVEHMEAIEPVAEGPVVDEEGLYERMRKLARAAERYRDTGGMHACGLALGDEIAVVREDVGRHNALDKVMGRAWLDGLDMSRGTILSSGRISYEMAVKAARAQAPIVMSRTGVTDLAVDVAEGAGLTLIGYARGGRMVVYTHPERVRTREEPQ
jgi:FdhD protein